MSKTDSYTCAYPGCDASPRDGRALVRVSAKGPGLKFVGMCLDHVTIRLRTTDEARLVRLLEESRL